ncbi:MAG: D-glycero-beta-D-manno-heptose 1-phosphate adenylyltransferase [Candidatus Omnitrophica bacterium]|nr:D-glycero-beta-D-manno-heptose 1-phosphate adenylyltransferase [Candidatus Omnitrophota bacterium]MDD5237124.1 D-glycero-beta-D-manno-heptose 1-phosphate adenylyltransferase [Candidatus Omnitrophota bacterium]MDD5610370.1 D-glycero-beta-D-manno-heptose 1-phosphate adenylyltransferase [Candidatus Omnitrophota bacterium]
MLEQKIKNSVSLVKICRRLKKQRKKVVFTNGCFDILHYGHVKYLEDAKKKGDVLIVALNSDSSIRRIKGPNRPLVNEKDRIRIIAALESVNYTLLFNETTPLVLIKKIKPDVLVKGADWCKCDIVGADFVHSYGGKVSTIALAQNRSTTKLIKKIVQRF